MPTDAPAPAPSPSDFLALDALLSPPEREVRDTARAFVRRRVLPRIADWYERGEFPVELAGELGGLGLLGMHLEGYGCAGASAVQYGLACMELEAGDSGLRSFVSVQGSLAMFPIWRYGSEEQKRAWLPRMAAGDAVGCFGLTEPQVGSNPAELRTSARRDGADWVLNGHKRWSTNATAAEVAVVWARCEEGVRGFLVPRGTPGLEVRPIDRKLSLRASLSAEFTLTDVRLPADAVLPGARGLRAPLSCLDEARYGIVWGAAGAARDCFESALAYAREREQFGRPIGAFQLTQAKLADMLVELSKAALLALHLGRMKDAGTLRPEQVSLGKLNNVREALAIARTARTILAANGITLDYPVMRHAANLESVLTYEGTSEIHALILGQAVTGLSAFA
ncbi:MAG TPA: acyl-CoA dehydrogenase family protein [Actinomycetes bacterium]|nr:acyl-CoA dehydrogenase family protein [Actinomycetes bacterium]